VLRVQKDTSKIRPVFDCAAKTKGVCLNDFLTQGSQVVTGDMTEMFLRVQVAEEDRDYLRFLIFDETDNPCIAMRAVFTQIIKQEEVYHGAYKTITTTSLVDNMANYRPTTQQTEVLNNELSDLFQSHCAVHIRRVVVNDRKLVLNIPNDDRMEALEEDTVVEEIFSGQREKQSVKILDISRNYVTGGMCFDCSTVIDIAIQLCWKLELSWIAELPQEKLDVWRPWAIKVQRLDGYSFERAPKAAALFQKVAYGCIPCRKNLTKQMMAPLPFYRMTSAMLRRFYHSAINVAGPFQTKIGRSVVTRWLLVGRCSTTGAVHLGMIDYIDTSGFLLAVEGFLALRPRHSSFTADDGANFKGGESALKSTAEKGQINLKKHNHTSTSSFKLHLRELHTSRISWKEAALLSAVHAHTLADGELRTVFGRAIGHLSNVPVACAVGSGADFHYLPIAPGHFLVGPTYAELKPIDTENTKINECNETQQSMRRLGAVLEQGEVLHHW
jgi:hypothetical protein